MTGAKLNVVVLHPGAMGASVAAALAVGHRVHWVSEGRSADTRMRAGSLIELPTLSGLGQLDVVMSVCPPAAALAQARAVMAQGFRGIYVDANAVSPGTARAIAATVEPAARYLDGGIIGPPADRAGTTRLYLSGNAATEAAAWFAGSNLEAIAIGIEIGAASALKMAYAAWTKGSSALLLAVAALAEAEGVSHVLASEWARSQPGTDQRLQATARGVAPKAWRFVGEMEEIAATFAAVGLPGAFHQGAAQVYRRLAGFKDGDEPTVTAVIKRLNQSDES